MQEDVSLCVAQGCVTIIDGCKPLKMKAAENRVFRFRGYKSPGKGFFNTLYKLLNIQDAVHTSMAEPAPCFKRRSHISAQGKLRSSFYAVETRLFNDLASINKNNKVVAKEE